MLLCEQTIQIRKVANTFFVILRVKCSWICKFNQPHQQYSTIFFSDFHNVSESMDINPVSHDQHLDSPDMFRLICRKREKMSNL